MGTIVPAISGPKRPQDYVALTDAKAAFKKEMEETFKRPMGKEVAVAGEDYTMASGKVVIASITSCTNTSNPYVMIGAGLVARKAAALGLDPETLGQDIARPGVTGCERISGSCWPARRPRQDRVQPRGLWLHDLHRQFRPDPERTVRRDCRG